MSPVDRILHQYVVPSHAFIYTATFFLYVGIVRSRYVLFLYYVHRHPPMTHGGTNGRRTCIDILDDDSLPTSSTTVDLRSFWRKCYYRDVGDKIKTPSKLVALVDASAIVTPSCQSPSVQLCSCQNLHSISSRSRRVSCAT